MATLIQHPDAVSFAKNIKDIIISSAEDITVSILRLHSVSEPLWETILTERYVTHAGRIVINIERLVSSQLSHSLPLSNWFRHTQSATFAVKIDNVEVCQFKAVMGGVEKFSGSATEFLTGNFLTWQQQTKAVTYLQPEYLCYYFTVAGEMKARFYAKDGETKDILLGEGAADSCYSANVQFSRLWTLGEISNKERHGFFDVWVENSSGVHLSYTQRYVFRASKNSDAVYLSLNSLGGIDTFLFSGEQKFIPTISHKVASYDDNLINTIATNYRKYSQNTGLLGKRDIAWMWEFFNSSSCYYLDNGNIVQIVIDNSSVSSSSNAESENSFEFEYRKSEDAGLLNIERGEIPAIIEVSTPESELFFLAPRLHEFPDATITDSLLLLCQPSLLAAWKKLSVGELRRYIEGTDDQTLSIEIESDNGQFFLRGHLETTLRARLYKGRKEITSTVITSEVLWTRETVHEDLDAAWNTEHQVVGLELALTDSDLPSDVVRAKFTCCINYGTQTINQSIYI